MRRSGPRRLSEILERTIRKAGIAPRVKGGLAMSRWPEAVGEIAARKSQPYRFARGRLSVRVDSSAWLQELKARSSEIAGRLNEGLDPPPVREIYFRLGEVKPAPASRKRKAARLAVSPAPPSPEEEARIDAELASISDPELREAIKRARLSHAGALRRRGKPAGDEG